MAIASSIDICISKESEAAMLNISIMANDLDNKVNKNIYIHKKIFDI